jgi:hypothetical protein
MGPFNEAQLANEENVKKLMELALISLNKEEALTMCWNALWFLAAIDEKVPDKQKTADVVAYFRDLREKITVDEIVFE